MRSFSLFALVACVSTACGGPTMDMRLDFRPENSTPYCKQTSGKPNPQPAWEAFQRSLSVLAAELGTRDTDPAVLLDRMRAGIRSLGEDEGCRLNFTWNDGDKIKYDIHCPGLTGPKENVRQRLERAVRSDLPPVLAAARSYLELCPEATTAQAVVRYASDSAQGLMGPLNENRARLLNRTVDRFIAGCSLMKPTTCSKACDRGDAEACNIVSTAKRAENPAAAAKFLIRECELRLADKDPKATTSCNIALGMSAEPSVDAGKILDSVCAAMPLDSSCFIRALLDPKAPIYDRARALRVATAVDECVGPECPKYLLLMQSPHYEVAAARRAVAWIAEECEAHRNGCAQARSGALAEDLPHFDRELSRRILLVAEQTCKGEVTITELGKPVNLCLLAFWAYINNKSVSAHARAFEIASNECNAAPPNCAPLATCYEQGKCGLKKDLTKARSIWSKECEVTFWRFPKAVRAAVPACQKADGVAP